MANTTEHDSVYTVIRDSFGIARRAVVTCTCGKRFTARWGYRDSLARRYAAHVKTATATEK